jgi:hypothetical protein
MKNVKQMFRLCVEHNPRHYTPIKIFDETYNVCSRCLGMWTVGLISFFSFALLYFYGFVFDFYQIFFISIGLGFICFIDWISAKTPFRNGNNNNTRIVSGAFLGIAVSMWFWLLPVDWFTRIATLVLIQIFFTAIVVTVHLKEFKKGLFDIYDDFFLKYKKTHMCCDLGCCGTTCCMLPQYCCYGAIVCCCCICPIVICAVYKKG